MKLKLKMVALAAAMMAAGAAHADLTAANLGDSSLALLAFNDVTQAYYVRDLGYTLNQFLPNSVTTLPGDGGVTGTMTPEAGLTLNPGTNANFADPAFATWLAGQAGGAANVQWTISAGDQLSTGANGVARMLLASSTPLTVSNGQVRTAVANAAGTSGLAGQNNPMGLSATGGTVLPTFPGNNILEPATMSLLDQASNLYYFAATTQTGSSSTLATETEFGNSAGFATVTLASNGDFSYTLAPAAIAAVPLPAAGWLFGSGLMGIGGMIRRRKAAAAAAA